MLRKESRHLLALVVKYRRAIKPLLAPENANVVEAIKRLRGADPLSLIDGPHKTPPSSSTLASLICNRFYNRRVGRFET